MKKQPTPTLIFDDTAFRVHGYVSVLACDVITGKKRYAAFIFRDRATGMYIAKDVDGHEYLPRSEDLETLKGKVIARFADAHARTIQRKSQPNTKSINR